MSERYHCDQCQWEGDTAELFEEPCLRGTWAPRVCPEGGTEVYATIGPPQGPPDPS
jgi:hypothetical protein